DKIGEHTFDRVALTQMHMLQRRRVNDDIRLYPAHPGVEAARISHVTQRIRRLLGGRGALYCFDDFEEAMIELIKHSKMAATELRKLQRKRAADTAGGACDHDAFARKKRFQSSEIELGLGPAESKR